MRLTPQHIPFARLADMAEGRAPAEESPAEERAHLASCARCAGQAERLGRLAALMRTDASEDAPPEALAGVLRMFRARTARAGEPGLLRRLVAALTFDSSSLRPAFGVRSGQAAPARQLLYSAGEIDVDLRLAPGGNGWTVSGQVLGPCGGGGEVEMVGAEGSAPARSTLNELCEFTLPPRPEGDYTLRLRFDQTEVEVPVLSLRA